MVHIGVKPLGVREQHRPRIADPLVEPDRSLRRLRHKVRRRFAELQTHRSFLPAVVAPALYWYMTLRRCRFARKGQLAASREWPVWAMLGGALTARARARGRGLGGPARARAEAPGVQCCQVR